MQEYKIIYVLGGFLAAILSFYYFLGMIAFITAIKIQVEDYFDRKNNKKSFFFKRI